MHMNLYVSDPCVWYIKKMVTYGGGREVDDRQRRLHAQFWSWFKPPPGYFFFANFHVTAILAIST